MEQELQDKLFEKYPYIFSNKDKSIQESCMAWGIEHGDGWYDIISSLCGAIDQHERNIEERKKYNPELSINYERVKFDQVKEKFGGLRVYFSGGDDYVRGLVSFAEDISYTVCEVCGQKGSPNKSGWISTLCDNCRGKTQ
jgi:hypothetical protein